MTFIGQSGFVASVFAAVAVIGSVAAPAQAIELYRISTSPSTLNNGSYDPARVTITSAPRVAGSSATDLSASETLSNIFANDNTAGGLGVFRMTDNNGTTLTEDNFSGGFFTFSIEADTDHALHLESLQFNANRGGSAGTRGFAVYAAVDGQPFLFSDAPLLSVVDEAGTRTTPTPYTIDLTAAMFQNVESATFRIYALTDDTGRSIEFSEIRVNGQVLAIPEPATALLGLAGLAALGARRRRTNA